MKKKLFLLLSLGLLFNSAYGAETLAQAKYRFRAIINEIDSSQSILTDSTLTLMFDMAQQHSAKVAGYVPDDVDITYHPDSGSYNLPANFKSVRGVMVKAAGSPVKWYNVLENPLMTSDTAWFNYFVAYKHPDTARIYLRGQEFFLGQTVRVFYDARPGRLDEASDLLTVASDETVDVIYEVILLYQFYRNNYGIQQGLWNQFRQDQGIIKQATTNE